jgi:hypothetical protein
MRARAGIGVCTLFALVVLVLPASAQAAFPGENGRIAFSQQGTVKSINPDGTGETPLRAGMSPAWSPDATRIAFSRNGVYRMPADGTTETLVTSFDMDFPSWSPDGSQLVVEYFSCTEHDCGNRLFKLNAGGGIQGFLACGGQDPAWSPAGNLIAFHNGLSAAGCVGPTPQFGGINTIAPDGTGLQGVAGGELGVAADWSPDGSRIAFATDRDGACGPGAPFGQCNEIYVVPAGGGPPTRLTNNAAQDTSPAWSPDGTQIAFSSDRDGDLEIWRMNADGSNPVQVTNNTANDLSPSWQPIPINTYVRPKGASPMRLSLVPAYVQCTSGNRVHGPPLAFPSCNPPARVPGQLTIGTFDANGQPAESVSYIRINPIRGNPATPADEADVRMRGTINDVRLASDLSDYTGNVQARLTIRITDRDNTPSPGGPGAATVQDFTHSQPLPCAATADTTVGSSCDFDTTVEALVPGAVKEQQRAIWQLDTVRIHDGAGNLFMRQGIFVP